MSGIGWLSADWPAPAGVRAGCTTRAGGVSRGPYTGLNLALHVGDDEDHVRSNRALLRRDLALPADPLWLTQTHSNRVIRAPGNGGREADAVVTSEPGLACAILTADCVPVLFCHARGAGVAAVHVGWRGLCAGILENTLQVVGGTASDWRVWLGPHICARHYEVGAEVRQAALARYPDGTAAFTAGPGGRWQLSLARLITHALASQGIHHISDGRYCTFAHPERFYSYRRDGHCGRMASLVWLDPAAD